MTEREETKTRYFPPKILDWDDDNFFDVENQIEQEKKPTQDFDDDSFWENYDFESVLD